MNYAYAACRVTEWVTFMMDAEYRKGNACDVRRVTIWVTFMKLQSKGMAHLYDGCRVTECVTFLMNAE